MEKDLAAAPKQHGGEELPEPVAKIHSDGYWTEGKSFKEPLNFASMELYTADQLRAPPLQQSGNFARQPKNGRRFALR